MTPDFYYLYDGLGSTRALSDGAGSLTDSYHYDAFGVELVRAGNTPNDYLFTGEQFDSPLQQYYLRARYYNQKTGRFTQMDAFAGIELSPLTLNKYTYTENDSVNKIDPSGNFSITGLSPASGIANTLALAVIAPRIFSNSLGIGGGTGYRCAKIVVQSRMGVHSAPRSKGDKECEDQLNQMRVQFQVSPLKGGVTLNTHASPVFGPKDPGVTVTVVEATMRTLFYGLPDWWPNALESPTIGLMARQSIHIRKIPPNGVFGDWTHKESIEQRNLEYRIDIENIRGHNLRRFQ